MYVPKAFQLKDTNEAVRFMQRFSFATLINISNNVPVATHLPFVVKHNNGQVILSSHLAKPNTQANDLVNGTSLVIFSEPHAYVAPKHYEKELNVPTWNYIAVHAYGEATIVDDETQKLESLKEMITSYDNDYLKQWETIPADFKSKMSKGIVVFDILVTDLQGKKKLSQNRSDFDKHAVTEALSKSKDINEKIISDYMRLESDK